MRDSVQGIDTRAELKLANHGAAAEDPSATHTELRSSIQQASISREEFIKQIESFKTPKPEFHGQLIQVFDNDSTLTELGLYSNRIGAEGAKALATALQTNSSLSTLYLGNNEIGDEGAQALATALHTNSSLSSLSLGYNQIGAEGAQALATALQTNKTLTKLDLWNNQIGDEGAQALATALHTNKTLRELYL